MMTILLGSLLFLNTTSGDNNSAKDYFVTKPGTKLTYVETSPEGKSQTSVDTVQSPITVLSREVIPVATQSAGHTSTTYYLVEPTVISIVAFDLSKPLKQAMPIMQCDSGKGSWDYELSTKAGDASDLMTAHGEVRGLPKRKFDSKMVEVIEVKIVSHTGGGRTLVEDTQVSVYAKGIGLLETVSTTVFGKQKLQRKIRLEKIEVPPSS